MNELEVMEKVKIEDLIYEVRGKQVMLDSDLAKLYQCKNGTKEINQAVKNNLEKFPERYTFTITIEEYNNLRSKFLTSSLNNNFGGRRYKIRVFTEQGVAMLATILKSKVATKVSIGIMDAFVEMRKYIANNMLDQQYINNLVLEHDVDIKLLKSIFDSFKEKTNQIYFPGQIFDSYNAIMEIFNLAKESLIIIDPYADETILKMISKLSVKVIIICKDSNKLTEEDINKYNMQYNNLKVIRNNSFHDRYFIIDEKEIYHCGTSINNVGNKIFSINKLEDDCVKKSLLEIIGSLL